MGFPWCAPQVEGIGVEDVRRFLQAWERPDSAVLGLVGEYQNVGHSKELRVAVGRSVQWAAGSRTARVLAFNGRLRCAPQSRRLLSAALRPPPAGDFDSREMAGWVRQAFGGWAPAAGQPARPLPLPNPPLPDQAPLAGKLFLVDVPGATQVGRETSLPHRAVRRSASMARQKEAGSRGAGMLALHSSCFPAAASCAPPGGPCPLGQSLQSSVAVGEPGIQLMDPDDYALDVLNDVLNSFGWAAGRGSGRSVLAQLLLLFQP